MKLIIGKPDYLYHIERWLCSIEDVEQAGRVIAFGVGFGRGEDGRLKAITNAESIVKAFEAEAQLHQSAERERVLREALEAKAIKILGNGDMQCTLCNQFTAAATRTKNALTYGELIHLPSSHKPDCILAALTQSASKETDHV